MGYNRSKSKTSRRVKRAKTNKRNNKRKQTFRKSRRVNRGGKGPQKQSYATSNVKSANQPTKVNAPQPNSLEAKAVQKQKNNNYDPDSKKRDNFNATKDKENYENILTNEENGDYLSQKTLIRAKLWIKPHKRKLLKYGKLLVTKSIWKHMEKEKGGK
jgi:hypothetical protein